jgi:peptidoglycan/xylan/chitin deacetylase (PgdA/CDA1 family)
MGSTRRRILHFTFDDGPDARTTPRLLDILDRVGVKATFFFSTSRFTGKERRNAAAPDLAREVAARGHQLGSHGYEHQHMSRLRPPQLQEQLGNSEAMFQKVFGTRTYLLRPPFGSRNEALDQMLADGKYVTVMWNVGMADWNARPPEMIRLTFWRVLARNELERGERGGVVLLHDTHDWSIDAFQLIMRSIAEKNCELLGKGEELYDVVDSLAPFVAPLSDAAYAARQAELREKVAAQCKAAGADGQPVQQH